MNKSLFQSKTFWFNVLTGVAQVLEVIPMDPQVTAGIVAGINVVLRLLTEEPVRIYWDR